LAYTPKGIGQVLIGIRAVDLGYISQAINIPLGSILQGVWHCGVDINGVIVGNALQGLLQAIAFFVDPTLRTAQIRHLTMMDLIVWKLQE